jgi:hypothetical protein
LLYVANDQRVGGEIAPNRGNPSQPLSAQGGHSIGHSRDGRDGAVSEADWLAVVSLFEAGASPDKIQAEIGRLELWQVYGVIAQHLHDSVR